MQNISITFSSPAFTIPLNYHHEVQSLLYRLLRAGGDAQLHDAGAAFGLRQYKLFTFSSLRGVKKIVGGRINFTDLVYLDVRSVQEDFCDALLRGLDIHPDLTLIGQNLKVRSVKTSDERITLESLRIKMLSPLTVHKTEAEQTYYYTPLDLDFSDQINQNFQRKYAAFSGEPPTGGIQISPLSVGTGDKYVTIYKGVRITAWRGEYKLAGKAEHLNFLYYCGLGARNSDGFGMFEPV